MLHVIIKLPHHVVYLCTVAVLACALGLAPVAKAQGEAEILSSGTAKMIAVPAVTGQESAIEEQEAEQAAVPEKSAATEKSLQEPAFTATEADEKKPGSTGNKTLLYVGGGVAAAAAIALALGGGGGSSGSDPEPEPEPPPPTVRPVGVDLAGDNWAGYLDLVNGTREPVTAVVYQNGSEIRITTTSTQRYGKSFVGKIFSNRQMRLIDQTTGETWTTFKGPAFSTQIDIYDYVNNFTALDRLVLKR
ncbi:MAG TPA: hypothetical protein VK857_09020 [Desulforhopalus sp.]|nr:hypothetical protein [Desulforhopalus sp.]